MAIVHWGEPCMKYVPIVQTPYDIKNGIPLLSGKDHVLLYPGWNLVHYGDWQNVRQHCLQLIRLGKLTEKGSVVPGKKAKLDETGVVVDQGSREEVTKVNLKTFPEKEAIEIIRNCNNPTTLKEWAEVGDSREFVKKAYTDRLVAVEKKVPTEPKYETAKSQWQIGVGEKGEIDAVEYLKAGKGE